MTANIDLAPTILELLGLPADSLTANGVSLTPTFDQDDPWPDRMIPIQSYFGQRWRGVRSRDYSLQSEFDAPDGKSDGARLLWMLQNVEAGDGGGLAQTVAFENAYLVLRVEGLHDLDGHRGSPAHAVLEAA